jgi:hypothetical protein
MPDRADVEQALAGLIADVLYPSGFEADSAIGTVGRVYRGWPVAGALETDLARGVVHVTVQPVSGTTRDRTRFPQEWQGACPPPTMVGVVDGQFIQFQGVGGAGQVAGIRVDGQAYAYRLRSADTAALVAAALAAQIRADRPALASDNSVFLLEGRGLLARVVSDGQGGRELRRQETGFRITFWCPDPATRDQVVGLVDLAVAGWTFIDVGGWACRLRLSGESSADDGSAGGAWRRDLLYSVEYPTVTNEALPAMLFGIADVNGVPFVG